ncbi:MAG: response regulator [Acidobacteriota bacterium]|nr:response regulator [Acidobacteriota bacterium]
MARRSLPALRHGYRNLPIRVRLWVVVAASVLPLVVALVYSVRSARANSASDARAASTQLAQLAAAGVAQFIGDSRALMEGLAKRPLIAEMRAGRCDPLLSALTVLHPEYANVGIVDPAGRVHCSSAPQHGLTSVAGSTWFADVSRSEGFTVGDPFFGPITHRWVSVLALPLRRAGRVSGYLALPVGLASYQAPFQGIGQASESVIGVFDSHGIVVVRSQGAARWVGRQVPELPARAKPVTQGSATLVGRNGVERLLGFAPVPGTTWTAYAGAPKNRALAKTNSLTVHVGVAAAVCVLMVVLVAMVLLSGIVGPVKRLASAAQRVGSGDYEERAPIEGPKEIAVAAAQFNSAVQACTAAWDEQRRLSAYLAHSQKLDAVGRLAGGIAHDLNNLFLVIGGYTSALQARITEPFAVEPLAEISAATSRAATLTHQLLAFSRRQILEPTLLNLNSLIDDIGNMLNRLIGEGIDISLSLDPRLRPVEADRAQLEQIVANLVVNARDAMPDGGTIFIATRNLTLNGDADALELSPGRYVRLSVTDSGLGMDDETKARAFEPFFTTKDQGEGSGLGLASAYGVIAQSGGTIVIASTLGIGTTVDVYLPAADGEVTTSGELVAFPEHGRERLLLVEDEHAVRELLRRMLTELGYEVSIAPDGEAALGVVAESAIPFDLIVTDSVMPGMGGRELVRRLAELDVRIPVLFVSGYAPDLLDTAEGRRVAFLQKPFTQPELAARLRVLLDTEGAAE